MRLRKFFVRLFLLIRVACVTSGIVFISLLILSFTNLPFHAYHWLGTSVSEINSEPEYIVFLGGGGMPSKSNLMRAFFVVKAAKTFPDSKVVLSLPGNLSDENSTPVLVASELVERGISRDRLLYENKGTNTRSQALRLRFFNRDKLIDKSILLVTSPEHMRRSVLSFRKAGFINVNALPAFENALEADLMFKDEELGGNQILVPHVGSNTTIRYQFWNHLKYEILVARELAALAYYKMKAWV